MPLTTRGLQDQLAICVNTRAVRRHSFVRSIWQGMKDRMRHKNLLFVMFASVALLESLSHPVPLTARCTCSTYAAIIIHKCLYRGCKLSWLTLYILVIFFGATSFGTTILLEPLHGMGALVTDATAARSSVKVASHAHLVSRGEWSASSKEMKWPSLEMHPRIMRIRMIMILVVMVSAFLVQQHQDCILSTFKIAQNRCFSS